MKSVFSIVMMVSIFAQPAGAGSWGPWSVSPDAPALLSPTDRPERRPVPQETADNIAAVPFFWLLTFYQKAVNRVNSGRCPMYPTCSQYSVLAIRKHGPVIGIVMTTDRLIHESDERKLAPVIKVGSRYRFDDPVENNDFWWYGK